MNCSTTWCRDLARLLQSVREHRASQVVQNFDRFRVIRIQNRDGVVGSRYFENPSLGLAIVFHRTVQVEVMLADVRNADTIERDAGECLLSQLAARKFHDRVRRTGATISASERANTGGVSGPSSGGRSSKPSQYPNESSVPTVTPAARRIAVSSRATVVLPCVPVTPITFNCRDGLPTSAWQSSPYATRLSATTHCGTSNTGS